MVGGNNGQHNVFRLEATPATARAMYDILTERVKQDLLKAEGRFPFTCADTSFQVEDATLSVNDWLRLPILVEEIGEVSRAMLHQAHDPKQSLRQELVQVAAIALAWIEGYDKTHAQSQSSP